MTEQERDEAERRIAEFETFLILRGWVKNGGWRGSWTSPPDNDGSSVVHSFYMACVMENLLEGVTSFTWNV